MNRRGHLFSRLIKSIARLLVVFMTNFYIWIKTTTENLIRRIRFSISFKIAVRYFNWLVVSLILSTLLINAALCFTTLKSSMEGLNAAGKKVSESFGEAGIDAVSGVIDKLHDESLSFLILDENGKEVFNAGARLQSNAAVFKGLEIPLIYIDNNGTYLAFKQNETFMGSVYRITVYKNINGDIAFLLKFFYITIFAQAFVLLATIVFGSKKNSKVLKPVKDMTEIARRISGSNLSLRINVKGIQDELKDLAQTINQMMDRIENSYNQQQQFVSDASHELRTPIAVLQGYANLLDRWGKNDPLVLQESINAIKNETENMKELVEKLLFLARNDRKTLVIQKERFDLSELLTGLVRETEIIDRSHEISCSIQNGIELYGDRSRIKQAVRIFIDNAVKYTPEDGKISVSAEMEESAAVISIKDTGTGISKEDLEHVFERFYRSDKSRTKEKGGHGLGLAIAKIIILGHDGTIKVRSKVGEGTEFKIYL